MAENLYTLDDPNAKRREMRPPPAPREGMDLATMMVDRDRNHRLNQQDRNMNYSTSGPQKNGPIQTNQTLAGSAPQGDVKPGPTMAAPSAAPEAINWKDPSWASKGVDFGKIESGSPVPGEPGATFVHTGTGWSIQRPGQTGTGAPTGAPPQGTTPSAAPTGGEAINWKDPSWAAKGVDFNKIESGAPVPGEPGATFVHTGTGWTIQRGPASTPAPTNPGMPNPAPPATAPPPNPSSDPAPPPAAKPAVPGQTNSPTPNAPATPTTATQGGQDVYRNTLINQMAQQEVPDVNDAAIKAQLDPMRAEAERAMRGDIRSEAEAAFASDQDFGAPEKVAAQERAGQQVGLKAADLVGRELTARRDQIKSALAQFGDTMEADQKRALEEKLRKMEDATKRYGIDTDRDVAKSDQDIKRYGIDKTTALGEKDISVREKLGMGGLNNDMIRNLMQDRQWRERMGFDYGMAEADLNERATRAALGI